MTTGDRTGRSARSGGRADPWTTVAPVYDRVVAMAGWHRALDAFVADLAAGRVLEVGCGPAHLAPLLLARGVDYLGVDRSAAMLQRAARRLDRRGTRLVRADVTALPFRDDSFDVVLATAVLGLLDPSSRRSALREVSRVTRREVWLLEPVHRPREPVRRLRSRVVGLVRDRPLELGELVDAGLVPRVEGPSVLAGVYSFVRATKTSG